jgi:CP family cyanate transporter-like MFS transporter
LPRPSEEQLLMSRLPAKTIWLAVGLMIISFNLRPAIVAVSPLLTEIQKTFGLSGAGVGLLSTLPLLCFGLLAPLAPRLVHRFGSGVVLLGCLFTLLAGVLVRSLPTLAALFLGTLLIGIGVAIANVLMPGILKQDFPGHVGIMVGLYTMMLSAGAAFAAGTTVPLYQLLGKNWHLAVGFWALPVALAIVLWLPSRALGRRAPSVVQRRPVSGLWRSSVAWSLTIFMGLQSLEFYATVTWLPTIFRDRGTPSETAGFLLALVSIMGMLGAFVAPWIAHKMTDQRLGVAIGAGALALGIAGLLVDPHHLDVLWAVLLGWGQGSSIGLALMMMVVRASSRDEAMALSGMVQGLGYLIASVGPVLIGSLFDFSHGWSVPLIVLLVLVGFQAIAGDYAARDRTVGSMLAQV